MGYDKDPIKPTTMELKDVDFSLNLVISYSMLCVLSSSVKSVASMMPHPFSTLFKRFTDVLLTSRNPRLP
jgi:hypothetical protein